MAKAAKAGAATGGWKEAVRRGGRKLFAALTWVLPVLILAGVVYYFVRPTGPGEGAGGTPNAVYESYTDFVRDYRPPAGRTPSQAAVNEWLGFFDSDSRQWFRANADRMAFVRLRGREFEWDETTRDRREMEAMQFVLTEGPLGGGVVRGARYGDDGRTATLDVSFSGQQWAVPVSRTRGSWAFRNMMGQQQRLEYRLRGVRLPGTSPDEEQGQ